METKVRRRGYEALSIGGNAVNVQDFDHNQDVALCFGTTVPTDASRGFAPGCKFVDTATGKEYVNEGSATSCDFNLVLSRGVVGDIRYAEVALTNAQMLALRATPVQLVAAPGAGYVLEFLSSVLIFDYTAAYTETDDNMAVKYENGSGVAVSDAIEATGFVDATADTLTHARHVIDGIVAASGAANKALVLHNTGNGEYGGGNAANVVRVKTAYRVHATGL